MPDFSTVITDLDGEPIPDSLDGKPDDAHRNLTLGFACRHALCCNFPDERDVAGEEKFRRAKLAFDIAEGGAGTLRAEDITLIKKLIGKLYGPIIVYRAYALLDPAEADKK